VQPAVTLGGCIQRDRALVQQGLLHVTRLVYQEECSMKPTLALLAMALVAAPVAAQDKMKQDTMMKGPTMQECKDMMAKKDTMAKKDDATMKKEQACKDMMAKDGGAMKGDAMAPKK